MHNLLSWITDLFHTRLVTIEPIARYGYAAIFAMVALEALGMPVPGESSVIGSGLLAARGDLSIGGVLACVWAGAVLGDSIGYLIGRLGGRTLVLRFGAYIGLTKERLAMVEELFRRRGAAIVVAARFVVVLRQLNGIVAGTMKIPWPKFLLANATGALLWALVWGLGSYLLAESLGVLAQVAARVLADPTAPDPKPP